VHSCCDEGGAGDDSEDPADGDPGDGGCPGTGPVHSPQVKPDIKR
jgi:hypothetical protein